MTSLPTARVRCLARWRQIGAVQHGPWHQRSHRTSRCVVCRLRLLPGDVIALVRGGRAHAGCALVHVLGVSITVQERVDTELSRSIADTLASACEREACCSPASLVELTIGSLSVPADERSALWLLAWSRQPPHLQRQLALEALTQLKAAIPVNQHVRSSKFAQDAVALNQSRPQDIGISAQASRTVTVLGVTTNRREAS